MTTRTISLEIPEVTGEWTVADLEKIETGDIHVEMDEGQLLIMPAAWYPWHSRVT